VHRLTTLPLLVGLGAWLASGACAHPPREHAPEAPDSATAAAIARDRPERLVVPLAGDATFRLERVSIARESLERASANPPVAITPGEPSPEPPVPEPGEPPAAEAGAPGPAEPSSLQPPIPRGAPSTAIAGRAADSKHGAAHVTLDVRVDEHGDVSDALLVESDADSLTVQAAIEAAMGVRYHPALLGGRPVAVWTRQVLDVRRSSVPARH
jgi:hypothetical protein